MGWRDGSRPAAASRHESASGFSLFELVVAMAVLAIGLALVGRLLVESQLGLARAQAELGNPLPRYALARIRTDLQGALGVPAIPTIPPVWRSSPLKLTIEGGERIAWQRSEDDLERVILGPSGEVEVRHVALRGVADWRWRPTADGLVDVELVYRTRDTSAVPLVGVTRTWSPPAVERSVWIRVALRAHGGAP